MGYKSDPQAPPKKTGEMIANSITHGLGAGLSIAGLVILIIRAARHGSGWYLGSVIVFGVALLLQYLASTIYHSLANKPWQAVLQRLDHSAIFLLIAGTYTPFLLTEMRTWWGWMIFGLVWGLALVMLILKLVLKSQFIKPPVWLYLIVSWLGVIVLWQALGRIRFPSPLFLLLGGAAYSLGIVFYRWRSLPYSHAIWHLFVLGGSVLHYFAVLNLV